MKEVNLKMNDNMKWSSFSFSGQNVQLIGLSLAASVYYRFADTLALNIKLIW